jgi:predicted nucleic acid-binding protein
MLLDSGEDAALTAKSMMLRGKVILLDPSLSVDASRLSIKHELPMADAIIYATTLANAAEVWTTDAHFKALPSVRYFEKN